MARYVVANHYPSKKPERVGAPKKSDPHWIEKAVANGKGNLRNHLKVKQGKTIPGVKLAVKKNDSPKVKKEKVLAGTLARLRKHNAI